MPRKLRSSNRNGEVVQMKNGSFARVIKGVYKNTKPNQEKHRVGKSYTKYKFIAARP